MYFFCLTGFLVNRKIILNNNIDGNDIICLAVKRYLRLFPVVFVSILITFLFMKMGFMYHLEISSIVNNSTFLLDYDNFEPTILKMLIDIFIKTYISGSNFVGPFWTIRYEFIGYILILGLCFIVRNSQYRRTILILIMIKMVYDTNFYYIAFLGGALVADLVLNQEGTWASRYYESIIEKNYFIVFCFIVGCIFAMCPLQFSGPYSMLGILPFTSHTSIRCFGMTLFLYALFNCSILQRFFSNTIFAFLGEISYAIYGIHWTLMLSLQDYMFSKLFLSIGYNKAAIASFLVTLVVSVLLGYFIHKFVEERFFTNQLIKCIGG